MSNYHGSACPDGKFDCITMPWQAIEAANAGGQTKMLHAVNVNDNKGEDIAGAVALSQWADHVILVLGLDQTIEAEGRDRYNSTLPAVQLQLAQAVFATGKPTIVLLVHGGAMTLGDVRNNSSAIMDCFYGGIRAADAMANVLFGAYNPTGKLAVTMYPEGYLNSLPLTQMSVKQAPGRTHLYYTGKPEFAFGDGLSYSTLEVEFAGAAEEPLPGTGSSGRLLTTSREDNTAVYTVTARNVGGPAGGVTLLAFWRPLGTHAGPLRQRLFDFRGTFVPRGGNTTLTFTLPLASLAVADDSGDRTVYPGEYEVFFKGASAVPLSSRLSVTGQARIVEKFVPL